MVEVRSLVFWFFEIGEFGVYRGRIILDSEGGSFGFCSIVLFLSFGVFFVFVGFSL